MPRERAVSEVKEPHSISLKVLRLSRPSLSEQHSLPKATSASQSPELDELSRQSHAYPSHSTDDPFILSPLLTLPPAFGNAYIGETFSCCLSANNETTTLIAGVRISAEMQTPSLTLNLELGGDERQIADLDPAMSLQKIVKYDLKEEGGHILAVTVTYTEAPKRVDSGEGGREEVTGRVRTFRKLYQFIAQQCLTVRTKIGTLPGGRAILEAQLENMGDGPISLEMVNMGTKRGWAATSLNWQGSTGRGGDQGDPKNTPMLGSRDVMQVAFLLHPEEIEEKREEDAAPNDKKILGQLSIEWRSTCGDRGYLSTGRLGLHV
ncbi:unnamed protein product [Tuber aestivum]|uniref:Trafficking protein particle complex subunit 13 n=1 Tax=Tuber aestivum TaxID=59557 RepID=A0A292Q7C1_9PEZI|nr:unnamed protein product [Tuber aestivum]